jgi:2-methylisocitrate lyase-like PEP mutase family enzyme
MASDQLAKAASFRALHVDGILLLPNAWDSGSAAMIAAAGATVIATTSAGMSWALGRPDGQGLTRDEMVATIARIVSTVGDLPVTVDIEGGYGPAPADVADTVAQVIAAGAVGANIEDSQAPGGPLFETAAQVERLRAARAAATNAGLADFVINARTDVFLFGIGEPDGRLEDVLARGGAYAEAGADCLFVPGLLDLDTLAKLTDQSPLPINVMAGPGAPDIGALASVGVRRVSVGSAVAQAAYSVARRAAAEVLSRGTYGRLEGADDFGVMNGIFTR